MCVCVCACVCAHVCMCECYLNKKMFKNMLLFCRFQKKKMETRQQRKLNVKVMCFCMF